MTKEELIKQAQRIKLSAEEGLLEAIYSAREFLKNYGGKNNSFYEALIIDRKLSKDIWIEKINAALNSFITYVDNDLLRTVSLEREIQIDTVSDYLEQATNLLNDSKVHPAAPAVIIGASLEEFLRNWLEDLEVDLTSIKLSLDSYTKELRARDELTKQDVKDIISWSGIRNDAAHGHWSNVSDRKKIRLMLDGVILFMRKYSS